MRALSLVLFASHAVNTRAPAGRLRVPGALPFFLSGRSGAYNWSMNAKRPRDRDGSGGMAGGISSMQETAYKPSPGDWVAASYEDGDDLAWRPCKVESVSGHWVVVAYQPSPGNEIFERWGHEDVRPIQWYGHGRRRRWAFADEVSDA